MDQATVTIFGIALLAALCIGAVGFVFVGGQSQSQKRVARVTRAGNARLQTATGGAEVDNSEKRRKQMQDTLKGLEEKQKEQKRRISLATRIERAGLETTTRSFYIFSALSGLVVAFVLMVTGFSPLVALLGGFAAGFGLPRWVLS